jgi:transcriptional regulator with XRE-family HTH domain
MKTELGQILANIRLQHNEILKDMAHRLNVTSAFLSAVENGKKKFPEAWYDKLANLYGVSEAEIRTIRQIVMESSDVVEIDIASSPFANRRLAVSFARQFDSLTPEQIEELFGILSQNKED